MKSIDGIYEDLLVINKSKFYAFAYPITTETEAKEIVEELNKKYNDATHVCYAYSLSNPRLDKADDDGEPSGTAGKPILELIKKRGLENVLVAVVRYFGGIKLGAGGLVRAYTNSGNIVLDKASVVDIVEIDKFQVVADVALGSKLSHMIVSGGGKILSTNYTEKVKIEFVNFDKDKLKSIYPQVDIKKIGSEKSYVRNNGLRGSEEGR